ncbi:MAG: ABC-F family ATP-binding cassette domain-containing protein [Verrucomicrobia bacterium]|nr:ABC-F family ATP-binding cassette domain-containing protein [Verrucomicrobiota bacterium]
MLTLADVSKGYAGRTLFAGVSLTLTREDRVGLIGANGAGKSTLFSIILGQEPADTGEVTFQRGIRLGHLPQESAPAGDETVLELATGVSPELVETQRRLRELRACPDSDPAEVHEWERRFEDLGGPDLVPKAKQVLAGLSFRQRDFDRPAREMSGGWVMRAHLARLLVQEPDLLMLDEPTNHLDLEALLWFQGYLKTYPGAILIISHDREFLNELVTSVIELRHGRMFRYRGNYDDFLEQREANEEHLLAAFKNQQREIARLERFIERFGAKNTKASQAKAKQKQIDRMEKIAAPQSDEATIDFAFPQPERSGLKVVTLDRVHFAYDRTVVYDSLDFVAERGQRTVLVGPNGAGKSTLLKLLAGVLTPQAGERRLGHNVKVGYYSQYRVEMLKPELTVLEEAFNTPQRFTETFARTVLGSFLFRGDDVFKRVSVLSGGEKSRLALVKLLLDPPNLLLMDEPTTHLDLASVDALLYALQQFQGTVVFISHDVYFIRQLANHVVHVQNGRVTAYPGDYQYYLDKTAALRMAAQTAPPKTAAAGGGRNPAGNATAAQERRERKRAEAEQRQERARRLREARQAVSRLEQEIAGLETRQAELTRELEAPATYAEPGRAVIVNREMQEVLARLANLTADWEAAATRLHELEA